METGKENYSVCEKKGEQERERERERERDDGKDQMHSLSETYHHPFPPVMTMVFSCFFLNITVSSRGSQPLASTALAQGPPCSAQRLPARASRPSTATAAAAAVGMTYFA